MTGEMAVTVPVGDADSSPDRITRLFTAHQRRLYALARRLSSTPEDASDLVQETFLRAARTSGAMPADARGEEAWLVRVLVNLCRDRWRQQQDRRRLDIYVDRETGTRRDAESPLVARALVWRALQGLPPRRRAVVVLHEIEGASIQHIAGLLGVTAVTVRWHLSRARRELRRLLECLGEGKGSAR